MMILDDIKKMVRKIAAGLAGVAAALAMVTGAPAADPPAAMPVESDYYKIVRFNIPAPLVLEIGGIELMSDGKLAVSTRRGDIYMVDKPFDKTGENVGYKLFAGGLHEVLGLAEKDGWLYATQRGEVTRLKDVNGDGRADIFETVADGWHVSGDYHEYAFGSKFDKEGNIWVVLCLTGSFSSSVPYRGWCVRVTPDGKTIPTTSGIRSPGGIGLNHLGDVFYCDNQGPWNGSCSIKHLKAGSFQGHPGGNKWYSLTDAIGPKPVDPVSKSRIPTEMDRIPQFVPPAVVLPHQKMGQSASGVVYDNSDGKFGPFKNQMFISEQCYSEVYRISMEKVEGLYQGACFKFLKGFGSGNVGMYMAKEGALFVGGTERGWGARGGKPFSLERVGWTGKVPFEVHEMRAKPDGFELTFTHEVDAKTAGDIASYSAKTHTYIYQADYGSPEVDHTPLKVLSATVAADRKSVRIKLDKLIRGHIHTLEMKGIRSGEGLPLLHDTGYYTMNAIPRQ